MTDSEAKGFVQGKLDCMSKCDIFNKDDNTSYNYCDNCEYCYSQGNFEEQKEAFQMAINALEKQIPKKPSIINKIGFMQKKCASCGSKYLPFDGKYCPECGQRLE